MTRPCIITVAITGSLPRKSDNPAVPITVDEQIESTYAAYKAGATLVHLHVRTDDGAPTSSFDRFATVLKGIREACPGIITQTSTGGRSGAGRERGCRRKPLKRVGWLHPGPRHPPVSRPREILPRNVIELSVLHGNANLDQAV